MKGIKILALLVLGFAVIVNGFPRERDVESEEDVEDIPLSSVPAVDVPAGPASEYVPSFYSFFPDSDLLTRIKVLVTRVRAQIGDSFGEIDWNKGNTTSTSKVIEGHVVTINETSFKDDDTDLVLHVKVIDVKPTEDAKDTSPSSTSNGDAEGNEIPNQPEEELTESLEYKIQPEEMREHLIETREYISPDYLQDDSRPVEVDNAIEEIQPVAFYPIPLGNDIRVNKIEKDKGEMIRLPDDVEIFVPDNRDMYTVNNDNEFVYVPKNMLTYERFPHRPRSENLINLT